MKYLPTKKPENVIYENSFLGDLVRKMRIREELTQQELADKVGMCVLTICNFENGKQGIVIKNFYKIISCLNTEFKIIIGEDLVYTNK